MLEQSILDKYGDQLGNCTNSKIPIPPPYGPSILTKPYWQQEVTVDQFDQQQELFYRPEKHEDGDVLSEIAEDGFEALAFYAPRTFYRNQWGIYFRQDKFLELTDVLLNQLTGGKYSPIDFQIVLQRLYRYVDCHELFHMAVELFTMQLEDFNVGFRGSLKDLYRNYHSSQYNTYWPNANCIEESLAQAYMFRQRENKFDKTYKIKDFLSDLAKGSPPAYRDWKRFSGAVGWRLGIENLIADIRWSPWPVTNDKIIFPGLTKRDIESYGPIPRYLVFKSAMPNEGDELSPFTPAQLQ